MQTALARFCACLVGVLVGVFLVVTVPNFQRGDRAIPLAIAILEIEVDNGDEVVMARVKTTLLRSPVVGQADAHSSFADS